MPGKVKVRILSGRNLPVMDRSSDTTDAFAEVRLGVTTFKTDVCRKTLNPVWNSEWFRFDVDDLELQDEPLTIRIMDYDTYSANDAIGKVYIDLNPLLWPSTSPKTSVKKDAADGSSKEDTNKHPGGTMCGWLPIFDTMHGVRGEVNVQVKVELFSDLNRFRQSSCGVQFFRTSGIPDGYRVQFINGFVEELVMNDDPEYQWIDKIRTPRASNEARQTLFLKLSGIIQRKIGLKALELGGNAVLGYQQKFDLESDNIVVRGIGTAVTLSTHASHKELTFKESLEGDLGYPGCPQKYDELPRTGTSTAQELDPNRPSPDQDMGCSPRGYNLIHAASEKHVGVHRYSNRVGITQESLELLEYPFITLKRFPRGFIHRFGGLVSCRSVKLLDGLQEDDDTRDIWWQDIRREVRSHARSLGCNIIVGYTEDTVIWEDIIILCASGTAVVGNLSFMLDLEAVGIFGPPFKPNYAGNVLRTKSDAGYYPTTAEGGLSPPMSANIESGAGLESGGSSQNRFQCSLVHIPYADISLPYACRVSKCRCCSRGPVPDVLICTVEPPTCLEILGRGCLMQATVVRLKKDLKGEHNAREVSDALPFVEYEIHRQLLNKMRVKGMNALFDVKFHVSVNDRTIVALATATGFFVAALPSPRPPKLQQARGGDEQYLQKMQLRLESKFSENMKYYGTEKAPKSLDSSNGSNDQNNEDSEIDLDNDGLEADLSSGNKDTCVLEIDDSEDVDILDSLMEYYPPPWIQVMSTEEIVGISPGHIVKCCQTFSQLVIQKINPTSRDLSTACRRLMNSLYFKLRRMKPCILCSIDFRADLNEENELQMAIYGSVICLAHGGKTREELAKELESLDDEDSSSVSSTQKIGDKKVDVKKVDVKKVDVKKVDSTNSSSLTSSFKGSGRNYFYSDTKEGQHTINLTPLSYVPGAKIEKYLGSLNFFLIRETSSLREVGGLNSFVQSFICEIYSIVRSHVSALGGNALVSFFISDLVVMPSVHKNQAQCLVHAGGDTVQITYLPPIETTTNTKT